MTPQDFDYLATLVKGRTGLVLTENKAYLLESRLRPLARRRGMKDLDELAQTLRTHNDEDIIKEVCEALTTNESFFFRDTKPFTIFKESVLPHLLESRAEAKKFRVWCAACSTGQEPYSIAMLLKDHQAELADWKVEIIGTDISTDVLERAKSGRYSQFEVQRGLPVQYLVKHFKKEGQLWQISPEMRAMVTYREYNLLHDFTALGKFDVVFCRNVLIYFDDPTKAAVLAKMRKIMPADGKLFLGGSETIFGVTKDFDMIQGLRGIYAPAQG